MDGNGTDNFAYPTASVDVSDDFDGHKEWINFGVDDDNDEDGFHEVPSEVRAERMRELLAFWDKIELVRRSAIATAEARREDEALKSMFGKEDSGDTGSFHDSNEEDDDVKLLFESDSEDRLSVSGDDFEGRKEPDDSKCSEMSDDDIDDELNWTSAEFEDDEDEASDEGETLSVLAFLMVITKPPHTRRYFFKNSRQLVKDFSKLPNDVFFSRLRLSRASLRDLCLRLRPHYQSLRMSSAGGGRKKSAPKPTPFPVKVFHCVWLFAHGGDFTIHDVYHGVGRTTMTEVWVPEFVEAVMTTLPIPPRPRRAEASSWGARAASFSRLAYQRVSRDRNNRAQWRRSLPPNFRFFDHCGEVFDGTFTLLQFKPQGVGAASQDLWSWKSGCYALNNLIGVDATGIITEFYRAMQGDADVDPELSMPQGFLVVLDSGFQQLVWTQTPFTGDWVRIGPNKDACRIYNFRLGQVRVVSENAFGRLKGRWSILRSIPFHPKMAAKVILACCCLHNYAESRGETVLQHWLTSLPDEEIGRASLSSLETATTATENSSEAGKAARVAALKKMGLPWVDVESPAAPVAAADM